MGWIVLLLILVAVAYVRLAPSDPARWHQPIAAQTDKDFKVGALRIVPSGPDGLAKMDAAARDLPRTQVLAGSVEAGRITYITRSKVFGFPDYTTIEQREGAVAMYARLRFGGSDLGVNRARLERLVRALQ